MGPLEKHCSELRAISWQNHDVTNATNSCCVYHEHNSTCIFMQDTLYILVRNVTIKVLVVNNQCGGTEWGCHD